MKPKSDSALVYSVDIDKFYKVAVMAGNKPESELRKPSRTTLNLLYVIRAVI